MKFLRHLLGVARLDGERNQSVREKLRVQNIVFEIKIPARVGTARRENGHRQDTQTGTEI
jgi:hypothetical protein